MSNIVKYGGWSDDQVDKDQADLASAKYMKMEVGRNIVRVLPPADPNGSPFVKVSQHFIEMPGASRATVFVCPRSAKGRCPACERADELSKTGSAADKARASDLWPSARIFVNVIDRKNPDKGPQTLGISKTVFEEMIKIRKQPSSEFGLGGDFSHPVDGFDLAVERTGTKKEDTKYKVLAAKKASPLHTDSTAMGNWISDQPDLGKMTKVLSYDEILALFGMESGSAQAQTTQAQPAAKTPRAQDIVDAEFE